MRLGKLTTSVTAAALALSSVSAHAQDGVQDHAAPDESWIFIPAFNIAEIETPAPDCSSINEDAFTDPHNSELVNDMKSYLWQSPTGRALLTEAQTGSQEPLTVCVVYYLGTAGAQYSPSRNLIMIEDHGMGTLGFFTHELAHRYAKDTGDTVYAHLEGGDNRDLVTFVGEAFAEATKNKVLWELKDQGYTQFWEYESTCRPQEDGFETLCYDDIARRYEEVRGGGGSAQEAHEAAFNAWFSLPRINTYIEQRRSREREALSRGKLDLRHAWNVRPESCELPSVNNRVRISMLPYLLAPAEEALPSEERLAPLSNLDTAFTQAGRYMLLRDESCSADEYMLLFAQTPANANDRPSAALVRAQP